MPGKDRPLDWVTGGAKLETDYTDAYGRNWYRSIGIENETIFKSRRSWWLRPSLKEIKEYDVEIHVLRAMYANMESISPTPFRYSKMIMPSHYARTMMAKNAGSRLGWILSHGFL